MFEKAGISSIIARVTHVDTKNKTIALSDGRSLPYDKIVLGTGASPVVPQIEGVDLEGVFTLRSAPDAEKIRNYLETQNPRKLIFIGAGFINLELASLLSETRPDIYEITVIELLGHTLAVMLDSAMGQEVGDYLKEKGFHMMMDQKVTKILGDQGRVSGVELESSAKIPGEMVILSVGARPNLDLAKDMQLEIGSFGVKVNQYLETSNPDVLAGGDCAEKIHFVTKKPVGSQLRGPAVIRGRLAAKRLAGYDIEFPGILNNSAVRVFDKYVAATGLTEQAAQKEGYDVLSVTVNSRSKHGMIPGVKPWTLKLVFDQKTQKLIGGQIISDSGSAVKEIDTVNALILGEKTIPEITTLICAGNPDCSSEPSLEPITIAAEQALQKMKRLS